MGNETAFQTQVQRIGEIVEQLDASADPQTRATAKELLECVMALHGPALERILELATGAGEPGEAIIRKCGRDEIVSSVLLLYGLHPESMRTRVNAALEKSRKFLEPHAANAELLSIGEDGSVTIRLEVKSSGCGAASLKSTLEAALYDAAPDATSVVVEEHTIAAGGFVTVAQLENSVTKQPFAAQRQGSAD